MESSAVIHCGKPLVIMHGSKALPLYFLWVFIIILLFGSHAVTWVLSRMTKIRSSKILSFNDMHSLQFKPKWHCLLNCNIPSCILNTETPNVKEVTQYELCYLFYIIDYGTTLQLVVLFTHLLPVRLYRFFIINVISLYAICISYL